MIALITYSLRTRFGLFATPISEGRGWSPEVFALAIAIQNIVWGLGQPFAGPWPTATVQPASVGTRCLGTLFGIVFLSHQYSPRTPSQSAGSPRQAEIQNLVCSGCAKTSVMW